MKRRGFLLAALAATVLTGGGWSACSTSPGGRSGTPGDGGTIAVVTYGPYRIRAEIAADEESRRQGLMNRENLGADEGMLFVYREKDVLNFWMKNTPLPLSIAFLRDDGTITNIERMKPRDTRPRYSSREPVRYALEVNQGWFSDRGIQAGDRLDFRLPEGVEVK